MKKLLPLAALVLSTLGAFAQGTAFTYQGRLNSGGVPANGGYDLQFVLCGEANGPSQLGGTLTSAATAVSNGLFTVTLDFGANFPGSPRWLEISVRTNGGGAFATLSPRQPLTATPYAITAGAVTGVVSAGQITGTLPLAQLPAEVVLNGASGVNLSGSFAGNGAGVTNVMVNSLIRTTTNTSVVGWGFDANGETDVPPGLSNAVAVAAGGFHGLALKSDGTVVAWGSFNSGQSSIPVGLNSVVAVAAGNAHSMALKSDGTIVVWGNNYYGQTNVPDGLVNIVAVSAGGNHNLALKSNGEVVAWGNNDSGQTDVPVDLTDVVAVAAGSYHSLALKNNGTVIVWGSGQPAAPVDLNNVVAVAAGGFHDLALKSDGTVVAWGYNDDGQTTVPADLSNVVAVAAGYQHSLTLKSDGTVVAWGRNDVGQTNVPSSHKVIALAAGPTAYHGLEIRKQANSSVAWLDLDNTFNENLRVEGDSAFNGKIQVERDSTFNGMMRINGNAWIDGLLTLYGGISGNGAGLTDLSAANLTGIVPYDSLGYVPAENLFGSVPSASLTSVPAENLTGTIADARLSANVALLNASQTFTGNLSFGFQTRQMLNFYSTNYGIGVQSSSLYFRCDNSAGTDGFIWYKGGVHDNGYAQPGTGGVELMHLIQGALYVNGTFVSSSDRNLKENFTPVQPREVLEKVVALPITRWNYKSDAATPHLGPVAQDFYAAFAIGPDDKHIATVDESGVALAAIQGLNQKLESGKQKAEKRMEKLEAENTELKKSVQELKRLVETLVKKGGAR